MRSFFVLFFARRKSKFASCVWYVNRSSDGSGLFVDFFVLFCFEMFLSGLVLSTSTVKSGSLVAFVLKRSFPLFH